MRTSWRSMVLIALSALAIGLAGRVRDIVAVEPAEAFLERLRERGLHDYAIEYLDRIESTRLVDDAFKAAIPYRKGVILFESAFRSYDPAIRSKKLDQARDTFRAFLETQAASPLALKARVYLAHVQMDRGRTLARRAASDSNQGEKRSLFEEARRFFDQASTAYDDAQGDIDEALGEFPKILDRKTEPDKARRRDELLVDLLSARLSACDAIHEKGKTYSPDQEPYRRHLLDAAERYADLYKNNDKRLAGLLAHLREGRCRHDLQQWDQAIGCYEDVIRVSRDADVPRDLITQAMSFQADCLIQQEKYDEVIEIVTDWLDNGGSVSRGSTGTELPSSEWIGLKYKLALAHLRKGQAIEKGDSDRRREFKEARLLAREVSRNRTDYRQGAVEILAELGEDEAAPEPTNFAEALEAGRDALDRMKTAKLGLDIARKNQTDTAAELERQYEEHRSRGLKHVESALSLATDETPRPELNQARFYLCFLHWELGHYYDAAVVGQFLATNYPNSMGARQAARIAMASFERLVLDPENNDPDFESAKLVEVANRVADQWPDQSDAEHAYAILIRSAVERNRIGEANELLEKIPEPRRRESEVKMGLALWAKVLRASVEPSESQPGKADRDKWRKRARELFERALARFETGQTVDVNLAAAALSLAQIQLDATQYDQAVATLEDPRWGPLSLLAAAHPAASRDAFAEEAYKAALRAYVSVRPPQPDKAREIMTALDARVRGSDGAKAAEKLIRIYLGLGRRLQQQLDQLRREGRQPEVERVSKAFEAFLDRIGQGESGQDWATRVWVAQTYSSLAEGLDQDAARGYYEKAAAAYDAILEEVAQDDPFAPSPDAVLGIKMRKAECLRNLHAFKEALDLFSEILADRPNMLEAQRAAAYTYQQRGDVEKARWYTFAWRGGRTIKKTGKRRVWGWSKLAQIVVRHEKYRDVFHEARYNLALCRYRYALQQADRQEQEKYLRMASNDIRYTAELYPDLGGDAWRVKYDRLLNDIQRKVGDPPVGLDEFARKAGT